MKLREGSIALDFVDYMNMNCLRNMREAKGSPLLGGAHFLSPVSPISLFLPLQPQTQLAPATVLPSMRAQ